MRRLRRFLETIYSGNSEEKYLLDTKKRDAKIPVNNVGFLSYVLLSWMTPLVLRIFKQRHKEIGEEDLWQCSDKESAAYNTERLRVIWEKEIDMYGEKQSSFIRVWLKFERTRLLILVFVVIVNTIFTFLMTGFMTDLIVSYLESEESNTYYAIGLLISNVVVQTLRTCTFVFLFVFGSHTGIRFRAGVLGMAYQKLIQLKNLKGDTFSEIINIFGSDSLKVYMNCLWFPFILSVPLYVMITAAYTYYLIGPWCFVAVGIFVIVYELQTIFTAWISNLRRKQMEWTDKRIRMTTEILNSMKMIKMYAWEEPFEESIKSMRNKEKKILTATSILTLISSGMVPITPTISSVATLAAYVSFGNKLQASAAFSVMSTLNCMRAIIAILPFSTKIFGEARVSFERIKSLLLQAEYQAPVKNVVDKTNVIEIKNGLFEWDSGSAVDEKSKDQEHNVLARNGKQRGNTHFLKLKGINLTIQKNKLIGVCGAVGSGKSSLISAILGRMPIMSGNLVVDGSVAYASQQAWILNGTLKENVVFGSSFDSVWYEKVIYACGLQPDIELLPDGDETEIGVKGINISGGQKQRISLARALYSRCDIYLLDDPLSAVDVNVGKHLFQECIKGLLKTKIVILVTHQLQYLRFCDEILVMGDGQIIEQGTHEYLLKKRRKYKVMMEDFNSTMNRTTTSDTNEIVQKGKQSCSEEQLDSETNRMTFNLNSKSVSGGKLTAKEKVEIGSVSFNIYKSYLNAAGCVCVPIVLFLLYFVAAGTEAFNEWWLGIWIQNMTTQMSTFRLSLQNISTSVASSIGNTSEDINATAIPQMEFDGGFDFYIFIYIGSVAALIIITVFKSFVTGAVLVEASSRMHNRALMKIMKAPISFFDANPPGRILNRFSRDIEEGDVYIPFFVEQLLRLMLTTALSLATTAVFLPWFLIVLLPALAIFFVLKNISAVSIRQLKRFENITRSPFLNHVTTTGQGLSTIVSYKQQNTFINKFMKYADRTTVGLFLLDANIRWSILRIDMVANMLATATAAILISTKHIVPVAFAGLAWSLCIKVTSVFEYIVQLMIEVESRFTSIERIHEYECLQTELDICAVQPDENWPNNGRIAFSDVVMRYRPDMDPVLRNISFDVLHKQKVGIVGRTGAGKSSLAAALFRLTDISSGSIHVDGVDIGRISRRELRSRLSIIPQDPVLFSGTLRYNLDPFGKHCDSELWTVMKQVHIEDKFGMNLDLNIEENGENFSVGERQLICLARALLRKNKILVLDEATASIDTATDTLIQNTIQQSFSDCTVLTIAHRLNTILHSDVIIVMESGCIMETGKPQDLLLNPSSYFNKMIRSQTVKTTDNK